jgi:predicted hydrolase (HD superfamily)
MPSHPNELHTPRFARTLMHQWVSSESLRAHMEAVAAAMRAYAILLDPGMEDRWEVTGLLHDFDYERHPTAQEHPYIGVHHLESLGVDEDIRLAILGHAEYTGTPRDTPMAVALFAVDELCGFIVACAKVRPSGIADLEARSVRKKLKDKAFAAAVSREDIRQGVRELAILMQRDPVEFEPEHIQRCIDAIRERRELVGV